MTTIQLLTFSAFFSILTNMSILAQDKLSIFTSSGYVGHLGRKGVNLELGLDYEIVKRVDMSVAYRYSYMNKDFDNKVEVNNISLYFSWLIINKNSHRLLIGPGFYYGRYIRKDSYPGFDKDYKMAWINPVRLQYDYTSSKNIRIGGIMSLYGDDGDGTTYFGFLLGYKF